MLKEEREKEIKGQINASSLNVKCIKTPQIIF